MKKQQTLRLTIAAAVWAAGASGCGESASLGTGQVVVSSWGEAFIEQQIPAAPPAEEGLVDGWSVTFSRFLVVIRDISIANEVGDEGAHQKAGKLLDHTRPGSKEIVTFDTLPAGSWEQFSYVIGPADTDSSPVAGASDADLDAMLNEGLSVHVVGEATKGDSVKRFDWKFSGSTEYRHCKARLDGKETYGVVVTHGGSDSVELTLHGDHFFYDDLEASTAQRRFEAIACADSDDDGDVTLDELAGQSLLPDLGAASKACRERPVYRPGSQSVNDLRAFVTALARTVGHYRGEGECVSRKLD